MVVVVVNHERWCRSGCCARRLFAANVRLCQSSVRQVATYERALIFLLLRLRRRTRFFLHLALILNDVAGRRLAHVPAAMPSLVAATQPQCIGPNTEPMHGEAVPLTGSGVEAYLFVDENRCWMRNNVS